MADAGAQPPDESLLNSPGRVVSVQCGPAHDFAKPVVDEVRLIAGLGVENDAHQGAQVKHRSRVRADPTQPNLRQVHLIHGELFGQVRSNGFVVGPGDLGENITTEGIPILGLPTGTILALGADALVTLTGLRNPCGQINGHADGLQGELLGRDENGSLIRRSGVMSIVVRGGVVRPGDEIRVALPPLPHHPMEKV